MKPAAKELLLTVLVTTVKLLVALLVSDVLAIDTQMPAIHNSSACVVVAVVPVGQGGLPVLLAVFVLSNGDDVAIPEYSAIQTNIPPLGETLNFSAPDLLAALAI